MTHPARQVVGHAHPTLSGGGAWFANVHLGRGPFNHFPALGRKALTR